MCLVSVPSVVCVVFYCFVIFATMVVCIVVRLVFTSCSLMVYGLVMMFVVYLVLLNVVCFLSLGVGWYIVSLCSACNGCCIFV